jgi:hypothetical protein
MKVKFLENYKIFFKGMQYPLDIVNSIVDVNELKRQGIIEIYLLPEEEIAKEDSIKEKPVIKNKKKVK